MKEKKNNNMQVYDACCIVPAEAKKPIGGGRLSGKTDINPMWRIKQLTELFGVCGFGWKYTVDKQWLESANNGEVKAFVNISLYVKMDGEWSDAIAGNGGSSFSTIERGCIYVNDECYKMATTDALSVACKQLGMGADVYWSGDNTKYNDVKRELVNPTGSAAGTVPGKTAADRKAQQVEMLKKELKLEPASKQTMVSNVLPEGVAQEEAIKALEDIASAMDKDTMIYLYQEKYPKLCGYLPFRHAWAKRKKELRF